MKKHTIFLLLIIVNTLYTVSQPVTQEWVRRWPDSSPVSSSGREIKQDGLGNIYVLADTGLGFGFLKYDPNGNLLFHTTYWPGGSYTSVGDRYFDVTSDGNVYIAGSIRIELDFWIYTLKFKTNGVFLWGKLYNPDNLDGIEDLKIDGEGNIVVVGAGGNGDTTYAIIIKYNPSGDTLWTRHFNGGQISAVYRKVTFDNSDNIYIVGDITLKCLAAKYNPQGDLLWFQSHTLQPGFPNIAVGIDLDVYGNIYTIGTQIRPQSQMDAFILKLNNNGDTLWSRSYPQYGSGNNSLWGPVVSSDGNSIYYTGSFRDTVGSGYNIVTLKYALTGDLQWAKIYNGGIPNGLNLPGAIKLDKYDNIYVCGTGYYQTNGNDFLTLKYSPEGVLKWTAIYTGPVTDGGDGALDMIVDTNLTVYVTGVSDRVLHSYHDAVTIKYNQPMGIISSSNEIPEKFSLSQNYPNPFNPKTNIKFQIAKSGNVKLTVFDILGREIAVLVNQQLIPGTYEVNWDGSNYPSGVYFYRLTVGDFTQTRKMVLIK